MDSDGAAPATKRRRNNTAATTPTGASPDAGASAAAARGANPARARKDPMAGARAAVKKKRAQTPKTFQWKAQRSGLPQEVRVDMSHLLKTGQTAAERDAAAAAKEAAKEAAAAREAERQRAAAAGEPEQPAPQPKRNHHKQRTRLPVVLSNEWERVEPSRGAPLHGVRRRLPRKFVAASQRQRAAAGSAKGEKIEFRISPRVQAFLDWFAELFPDRTRPVTRKERDDETGFVIGILRTRGPAGTY